MVNIYIYIKRRLSSCFESRDCPVARRGMRVGKNCKKLSSFFFVWFCPADVNLYDIRFSGYYIRAGLSLIICYLSSTGSYSTLLFFRFWSDTTTTTNSRDYPRLLFSFFFFPGLSDVVVFGECCWKRWKWPSVRLNGCRTFPAVRMAIARNNSIETAVRKQPAGFYYLIEKKEERI